MASVPDADDIPPDGTTNRDGEAPVVQEAETTEETTARPGCGNSASRR